MKLFALVTRSKERYIIETTGNRWLCGREWEWEGVGVGGSGRGREWEWEGGSGSGRECEWEWEGVGGSGREWEGVGGSGTVGRGPGFESTCFVSSGRVTKSCWSLVSGEVNIPHKEMEKTCCGLSVPHRASDLDI